MKAWQKTLMALGSVVAPATAMAAEAAPLDPMSQALALSSTTPATNLQEEAAVPSRISGFFGTTVSNAYISRWVLLENQGVMFQPYAEIDFSLFEEKEGFVKSSYLFGGVWSSLHTHKEAGTINRGWYEFDWYVGIAAGLGGGFSANLQYVEFISPANAFGTAKNIILNVGFDDTEYLKTFALKPYVQLLWETDGKAGTGTDEGVYLELGINPGVTLGEGGTYPLTLSLPVAAGFSLGNFYNDAGGNENRFGGFRVGVAAGVPLAFMNGQGYGEWSASGNLTYWHFGDGTEDAATGPGSSGTDGEFVATVGVQCNF
jgi:hypothetical protein